MQTCCENARASFFPLHQLHMCLWLTLAVQLGALLLVTSAASSSSGTLRATAIMIQRTVAKQRDCILLLNSISIAALNFKPLYALNPFTTSDVMFVCHIH